MAGSHLWLGLCLVLACHIAPLHTWWFNNKNEKTTAPPPATTLGAPITDGTRKEKLTDVGLDIMDVANSIQQTVKNWDQKSDGELGKQQTGNESSQGEEQPLTGSEEGVGNQGVSVRALAELDSGFTAPSDTGVHSGPPDVSVPAWMTGGDVSPVCLPHGSDWGFCLSGGGGRSGTFALPNFLNHTTADEVGATLADWAVFLSSRCHRDVERFFCLLLAPACPGASPSPLSTPPLLPCRSLCEILTDACWAALGGRDLPVTCHSLPEGLPHQHPCQPVSSCRCAGNAAG